jgi:hypothetical protein
MSRFLLHHRHAPLECGVVFASWRGHESPLRSGRALATCLRGGHEIWWEVEAPDVKGALRLLPTYVAVRTTAIQVGEVEIP